MKIRSYQALPELLRNRFCKKCQERIIGRGVQAKYCLKCAKELGVYRPDHHRK